jgi:hypothetical protein
VKLTPEPAMVFPNVTDCGAFKAPRSCVAARVCCDKAIAAMAANKVIIFAAPLFIKYLPAYK